MDAIYKKYCKCVYNFLYKLTNDIELSEELTQETFYTAIKKINTLEIDMHSKEYIEIKEIWYFEKFLRDRFQFGQVHMIIKYEEGVRKNSIEEEWENIICYMAHKYPLMRPLLLLKSKIEVDDNKINVYMKIKGADFLKARKLDRELENVIFNLFEKKYTINIEERITEQEVKIFQEKTK